MKVQHWSGRCLVPALLAAGMLALAGCGGDEDDAEDSAAGQPGVLRIAQAEAPDAFDPATLGDNRSIELAQNVFDGLTAVDEETLEVAPALAERWSVSPDGKTYTFTLRDDATFHDGTDITAQDVVAALNRTLSPATGSGYVFFLSAIQGATEVNEGKAKTATGIKARNANTVEITLKQPAGYFPALSGMWPYWVVSQETVAEHGKAWTNPPNVNGSGAFRLTKVEPDASYTFEAYDDYYRGKPKVDRVVVSIVPDPAAQLARYEAGEFDVIYGLSAATYRQVQDDEDLKAQFNSRPQLRTTWLNMRNDRPPFDDRRVRLAFNHAIDKDALIEVALGGLGSPAHTFLPPGLPGSVAEEREPLEFDAERAKELLAEAGFENGEGFPRLEIHFPSGATNQTVFEFVQGQLRENLGIEVGLKPMPINAYNDLLNDAERRPILSQYSFGLDYPDPQEQHEYLGLSQPDGFANYANFSSPRFDRLIARANGTSDQEERYSLHEQAENIYLDAAPIVPLYHPLATWLAKPYVEGFDITPLYQTRWSNVSVEP
jgi:oligopeptide transport system substrate-binding protein